MIVSLPFLWYYNLFPNHMASSIALLVLLVWIGSKIKITIHEVRKVLSYKNEVIEKNKTLTIEFDELNNELNGSTIVLKSKAVLLTKDICYVKADGPYTEYFLDNRDKPEIDRNPLKKVAAVLLHNDFVQIYRSIIVNRLYINRVENNLLYLKNGVELPVSDKYRKHV